MTGLGGLTARTVCRRVGDGWSLLARRGIHGVAILLPGGSLGIGGEPLAPMNWAYVHGPGSVGETVRRFVETLDDHGLPGVVTIAGEVRDEGERAAEAAGLERGEKPSPLMAVELSADPVEASGFEVRRVTDREGLDAAVLVLEDAYDSPRVYVDNMVGGTVPEADAVAWYVGYAGEQPASVCAVALVGPVAGVYAVGTAHAHRRKGAARGTIATALRDCALRGGTVAGLLSDTGAIPLYEELGFRTIDEPSEWNAPLRESV